MQTRLKTELFFNLYISTMAFVVLSTFVPLGGHQTAEEYNDPSLSADSGDEAGI